MVNFFCTENEANDDFSKPPATRGFQKDHLLLFRISGLDDLQMTSGAHGGPSRLN